MFRYFPNFPALSKETLDIEYHVCIDKYRHSSAAVTPVKYECDSTNLTVTFARSKMLLTEKLTNRAVVTPPLYFKHCIDFYLDKCLTLEYFSSASPIWNAKDNRSRYCPMSLVLRKA